MKQLSLKTRMALAVSIFFLVFCSAMGYFTLSYFQRQFRENVIAQQTSLLSVLAAELDGKLLLEQKALVAAIPKIPSSALRDSETAQAFLDSKSSLHVMFDNGLFLISREGRLIAESPYRPNRRGRDVSFREYFTRSVATGKPQISSPYVSTHTAGRPAIILTVPILDAGGGVIAILAGSLDLRGENIIGRLSGIKFGKSGYVYLSDENRTIISYPDRRRILEKVPVGVNKLFDRAMEGFEGSGETVTTAGVPVFSTYKHLRSAPWVLAASFPVEEANVPLHEAERLFIRATALGLLGVLVVSWFVMQQLMRPLARFTRHIKAMAVQPENRKLLPDESPDEIGTMGVAFNSMMRALQEKQKSLRESESNFKALAENADVGILILVSDGKYLYANRTAAEITGYGSSELLKTNMKDLAPSDEFPMLEERLQKRLAGEEVLRQYETAMIRKDGTRVPIEVSGARTLWHGEVADLVVIRDITERKRMEDELRSALRQAEEEKAKSESIIAAIGDGISIHGRDFRVLYQNRVHEELIGGGYVGEHCYKGFYGNEDICVDCPVTLCFADGLVHKAERKLPAGGSGEYAEISVSPLRDASGEIIACIEVVRDITERKRTEEKIRKLNEELEQRVRERTVEMQHSIRELESFCYSVSHDLRTPLRGINGFCGILQEEYSLLLDDAGRGYLVRIGAAAARMGELIDDLLALARVSRGELRFEHVDLGVLARGIVEELGHIQPDRTVELAIAEGITAVGDPLLLRVVLENLLGNAWKFTERHEAARIELGTSDMGGERIYFVRDNGVGFDMRYADKLFLPFQRLHGMEEFEGTGIGLATVQRVVNRHGGRVWAESEPGRGATFFFTLGTET